MDNFTLLEVNFLYDPDCPSVGRLVGRSVIISSSIYMLLSKHLSLWVPRKFYFFEAGASLILTPSPTLSHSSYFPSHLHHHLFWARLVLNSKQVIIKQ